MLVCCWSSKGGSGTTVVAASLALVLRRSCASGVVAVDLAGDLPAVLGVPDGGAPGVAEWLAGGDAVPADGLARIEVPVATGLTLVPRGVGPLPADRAAALAGLLAADPRPVVVDAGVIGDGSRADDVGLTMVSAATRSILVIRLCYLALRRAVSAPVRPTEIVVVAEDDRALAVDDVTDVLGVDISGVVPVTPDIARAVDAGMLSLRLPRLLERGLRRAA